MTFLNAVLLGGLAAVSIPVIIHLFHRSRFKIVSWGAMHLLESVLRKNRRRIKLEQLILLLVRCSIPCLLALLMARPVLTGDAPLLRQAKTSLVLIVDNSYSMEAGGPSRSNFQQLREAAGQILDHLVPGSEVSVVRMAGGVSTLLDEPSFDVPRVKDELLKTRAGFGAAAVPDSLKLASGLLGKMNYPNREVVLLTDFQRVSWSEAEAPARANVTDLLRQGPLPPNLTFFHVGEEPRDNVSVESLNTSRMILGVGQKLQVRGNLKNHGDATYPDLRVVFRVDGKERSVTQITLGPREETQVLFTHAFDAAGSHVLEVFADADPLQADNSCMASIPVWNRVPVLLVSGDSNPEPLKGETDFLEIALRPYGSGKIDLADLITPQVVDAREFDPKSLGEVRVVLLANVPQLNEAQLKGLEAFVREGGGLLIFPGNRINAAWYNTTFAADGKGLLPARVESLAGTLSAGGSHSRVVTQHYAHDALLMFNDPRNGNLSDAEIWLWYKLRDETQGGKAAEQGFSVLARLDTRDPFLVEKRFGEGRVVQSCIPCDADWSNLPMRPFYLPLMQQVTTYLASKVYPPRNVEVGKPLVAFLPAAAAGKKGSLTDPEGKTHEVAVASKGSRAVAEFARTQAPGLYTFDAPGSERVHFVVNVDRKESDLRQLPEAEIQGAAKGMGAHLVRSFTEYRQQEQKRRYGQEVWQLLLAMMVVFIFAELLLQQWFARRK